ncbi:MAG: PqiA/YebS family transporter subunit [Proteobacteria bacterium]|nr:PqiA/YebS family transporter subunit [Pseudomonadota bacterium]
MDWLGSASAQHFDVGGLRGSAPAAGSATTHTARALRRARHGKGWRLRGCHDCGLFSRLPPSIPGMDCRCPRCGALLRRDWQSPLAAPLALAGAGLILCAAALTTPFMSLRLLGQVRGSTVDSGAWVFVDDGLWTLALVLTATVVLVPLLRLSLRLVVLGGLALRHPPRWLYRPLRWHGLLNAWSMLEIFLFSTLIAYTRLASLADVQLGPAIYALAILVLIMIAADMAFEPQAAWDALESRGITATPGPLPAPPRHAAPPAILACPCCHHVAHAPDGTPCPRCGTRLCHRKPASLSRCWALIAAATILYVPANLYPVMTIVTAGHSEAHTILGGIAAFVATGSWSLATVVFVASVIVPLLKLAALATMLLQIARRSSSSLRRRTKLYRLIEFVGRWSMIDVFIVSVLVALVRFGIVASITAEIGAACFGAVVVLTMLAAATFDPRLMWDAAGIGDRVPEQAVVQ